MHLAHALAQRQRGRRSLVAAIVGTWWLHAGVALGAPAETDAPGVTWRDEWQRFRSWQYVATPAVVGASLYLSLGVPYRDKGHRGGVLFDDAVRDLLVADTRAGRDTARVVSDYTWRALMVYPVLEPLAVAWLVHGSSDVAAQMFLINAQSIALAGLVAEGPIRFIGRERPSGEPCESDPDYEAFCGGADRYGAFPSGHSTIAVAGASLTCVHGEHLPLYGGGLGNRLVCYLGIGAATATGVGRLVNDRHYATDVLVGSLLGFGVGYLIPKWLHYGFGSGGTNTAGSTWTLAPLASPTAVGLSVFGVQ